MFRPAIILAAFTICATSALADPAYVSFQVPGAVFTQPRGINAAGDVTGSFIDQSNNYHGFVRLHDGTIQTFDAGTAGKQQTQSYKINNSGEIAGAIVGSQDAETRGFLRKPDGTIKTFKMPGNDQLYITGLNNKGAVTGYRYDNSSNTTHGFMRKSGGAMELFDIPAATRSEPGAIGDNGIVAGVYFLDDFPYRGFIRDKNGTITTFDPPQDSFSSVVAINTAGAVAGNMLFDGGFVRAPNGTFTIFTIKNKSISVKDMNAEGAITGWYVSKQHERPHGFVRAPDGTITKFDYPTANNHTYPAAINDSGVITGDYISGGVLMGFLRIP